jgi:hypothetical protein
MTIKKLASVSAMFSLVLFSLALLCPAKSMASSGGGCNEDDVNQGAVEDDVTYCFNTDLSGYAQNEGDLVHGAWKYVLVGVSVDIRDTTAGADVFMKGAYSNTSSVELDFTASEFHPAPISGHVYLMKVTVCGAGSNSGTGQCTNYVSVPNLPTVTY